MDTEKILSEWNILQILISDTVETAPLTEEQKNALTYQSLRFSEIINQTI